MQVNPDFIIYGLLAIDALLFVGLIEGYSRDKRFFKIPKVSAPTEAFAFFETSYKQLFPQERDGFTWQEAVKKAKGLTKISEYQWDRVQRSLEQYEAYRYGGIGQASEIDTFPILKLGILLRQKTYYT